VQYKKLTYITFSKPNVFIIKFPKTLSFWKLSLSNWFHRCLFPIKNTRIS